MSTRNRAEGWAHAKKTGHINEEKLGTILKNRINFQKEFLTRIGVSGHSIKEIRGGGRRESLVESVFSSHVKTKTKVDMYVDLDDGRTFTCSIKKSLAGQAYLVTIENFIEAFEKHFSIIPNEVKEGIRLYWGSHKDTENIINEFGTHKQYELKKHRIVADTIKCYDPNLYNTLLDWFIENAGNITELCFARGGASLQKDWAQFIWYKNEIGETSIDEIFCIKDICAAVVREAKKKTFYGKRNGGSTIQLPFGFVQWHSPRKIIPGCIQFHHKYECLSAMSSLKSL